MAKQQPLPRPRKQPLGTDADRTPRKSRGRTGPEETPVEVRAPGLTLDERVRPFVREKLGLKLAAFAEQIERVMVTFRDVNGPKGGRDTECRLRIVLVGRPDVVVHETDVNVQRAFERAHRRVASAVKRDLERAGIAVGRHVPRPKAAEAEGATAEPEAAQPPRGPRSKAAVQRPRGGGKPGRATSRKGADSVRSDETLAKRARDRAHTPKAHAETSKVSRKGK